MAIKFSEIKKYLARNVRLSICFEDGYYDNYLIRSDIPEGKYDDLYVFGVGKIDVEFSKDVYTAHQTTFAGKDISICPALEIVLWDRPRVNDPVRRTEDALTFGDLRFCLQIMGHYSIVMRQDWTSQDFEWIRDVSESYNDYYVYGIGLEEDPNADERFKDMGYDNSNTKRMVIVLSSTYKSST